MINITLNGELFVLGQETNIIQLLEKLGVDRRSVAIELNLEILPKSRWEKTIIAKGDKIELVQFVGGG